ncbi:unnamed protein product [Prorocentrum cordatum]|uniref:Uncharacterized protein n=1 Tax=Prorocentrum cordatum TaxID=2364126 RepID=A0ABN9PYB4_9DINO|nr:unnamed protein product [Polarella glacialis]
MLVALGPLAQAAAAGAAAGGGSPQVVAAAVAAAIRTGVKVLTKPAPSPHIVHGDNVHEYEENQVADVSGSDEVRKEVDARLGMARPFLTRKVEQRSVTPWRKPYRNVALKDSLGAGVDSLPRTALEDKRRQRGGRRRLQALDKTHCESENNKARDEVKKLAAITDGPVKHMDATASTAKAQMIVETEKVEAQPGLWLRGLRVAGRARGHLVPGPVRPGPHRDGCQVVRRHAAGGRWRPAG